LGISYQELSFHPQVLEAGIRKQPKGKYSLRREFLYFCTLEIEFNKDVTNEFVAEVIQSLVQGEGLPDLQTLEIEKRTRPLC